MNHEKSSQQGEAAFITMARFFNAISAARGSDVDPFTASRQVGGLDLKKMSDGTLSLFGWYDNDSNVHRGLREYGYLDIVKCISDECFEYRAQNLSDVYCFSERSVLKCLNESLPDAVVSEVRVANDNSSIYVQFHF